MRNEIGKLVRKYTELASKVYNRTFPPVTVDITPRRTTVAGRAYLGRAKVWINIPVHQAEPGMLEDTVAHEVAHLVSYELYGRAGSGHGKRWKSVMVALGQTPDRLYKGTDEQLLVGKNMTRHVYRCGCGHEMNVSAKRHNAALRGAGFHHKGCRGVPVTFVRTTTKHDLARERIAARNKSAGVDVPPYHAPKRVPTLKTTTAMSKLDRCRKVYDASKSRAENIRIFVTLDCTPAGAATYYYKIKNGG